MMFETLLLHSRTRSALERFMAMPSQVLTISGAQGAGKTAIAHEILQLLIHAPGESSKSILSDPRLYRLEVREKSTIGIEEVRELVHFLSIRATDRSDWNRFILIENSGLLSIEAQNALLKSLESLPNGVMVIMLAERPDQLLETVRSRSQFITVLPVTYTSAANYFQSDYSESEIKAAYALSGGHAGLLLTLLSDKDNPNQAGADLAKKILAETTFQRLLRINDLSSDTDKFEHVLSGLQRILGILHASAINRDTTGAANSFLLKRRTVNYVQQALKQRSNPKLSACYLLINL